MVDEVDWLTLTDIGQLGGTPPKEGTFTFRVHASSSQDVAEIQLVLQSGHASRTSRIWSGAACCSVR
jgi:hypothetical protein